MHLPQQFGVVLCLLGGYRSASPGLGPSRFSSQVALLCFFTTSLVGKKRLRRVFEEAKRHSAQWSMIYKKGQALFVHDRSSGQRPFVHMSAESRLAGGQIAFSLSTIRVL